MSKPVSETVQVLQRLYRVRAAAEACEIGVTTLDSAIRAGRVPCEHTACGLPLVTLADVREFRKTSNARKKTAELADQRRKKARAAKAKAKAARSKKAVNA